METKDIFYIIGISVTIVLSITTLIVNLKNRRNALREHLYKEQFAFLQNLFSEIINMNMEFDKMFNSSDGKHNNLYQETLEKIAPIIFKNELLLPNDLSLRLKELIQESHEFYIIQIGSDNSKLEKAYTDYYNRYYDLLDYVKNFIGTDMLSDENKSLHEKGNSKETKLLKEVLMKTIEQSVRIGI